MKNTLRAISLFCIVLSIATEAKTRTQKASSIPANTHKIINTQELPSTSSQTTQALDSNNNNNNNTTTIPQSTTSLAQPSPSTQQNPTTATQNTHISEKNLITLDSIVATIMNDEGTEIITLSDSKRPGLSGAPRTLDDMVFELLVFLDAMKHKITPDDDTVDKYLESIQKDNNMTREQLGEIFSQSGYTFEEGRQEFKKMQANNIMLEYEIKSNLVVPRKKIEKYFSENPEIIEARYQLAYVFIPFKTSLSHADQLEEIAHNIALPPTETNIEWNSPFWITKSELAEEKYFICDLTVGATCTPQQTEQGFEVYYLTDKEPERLKTIEERYTEIANILRRPRYLQLLEEYKTKLFATSSVQYF